jgi:hypothetical protein
MDEFLKFYDSVSSKDLQKQLINFQEKLLRSSCFILRKAERINE